MKIKSIIIGFDNANSNLAEKIDNLKGAFGNEEKLWSIIENTEEHFFLNCRAFDLLADSLQLVDNSDRLSHFELSDIENMYRLLVKYYPENIQYKIDLIEFVYRVLDNEEEATHLIGELLVYLDQKRQYLTSILCDIKNS